MGTVVTIEIVGGPDGRPDDRSSHLEAIDRAFAWVVDVERRCSRFEPDSEVSRLSARPGEPVAVSAMTFAAVEFALAVARETDGAFDPTVGAAMTRLGFDRHYQTGAPVVVSGAQASATFRDVVLDPAARTITLQRPLALDLGAVAKGLAVDMAARELQPFGNFAIDAGGDVYCGGRNADGRRWTVGIRHPREDGAMIDAVQVSDAAVCTSGDYERRQADGHHLLDPRTGTSATAAVSATVIAPTAMLADALATAAFVLGPVRGLALLERHGVDGLIVSPDLVRHTTRSYASHA